MVENGIDITDKVILGMDLIKKFLLTVDDSFRVMIVDDVILPGRYEKVKICDEVKKGHRN